MTKRHISLTHCRSWTRPPEVSFGMIRLPCAEGGDLSAGASLHPHSAGEDLLRMDHEAEFLARFDQFEKAVLERLDRFEKVLSSPVAEYCSIKLAAKVTSLSYSHIRRAVLSGELQHRTTARLPIRFIGSPEKTSSSGWKRRRAGSRESRPSRS